jgi:hypothetical protein
MKIGKAGKGKIGKREKWEMWKTGKSGNGRKAKNEKRESGRSENQPIGDFDRGRHSGVSGLRSPPSGFGSAQIRIPQLSSFRNSKPARRAGFGAQAGTRTRMLLGTGF